MNKHGLRSSRNSPNVSPNVVAPPLRFRNIVLALLLMGGLLLAACGGPSGDGPPVGGVESVTIEQGDQSLAVGASTTLTVDVVADEGVSTAVDWASNNTDVATIGADGALEAVAVGSATITATSRADSSVSDSISVTVREGGGGGVEPPAPEVSFTADPETVQAGALSTLTWSIVGDYDTAEITDSLDQLVEGDLPASGSAEVTVTESQEYTLTVHYGASFLTQRTVTVAAEVPEGAPSVTGFTATVVPGSMINFTWTGDDALDWELLALGDGATQVVLDSGAGSGGDVTVPIPPSATPSYRVVLNNIVGSNQVTISRPSNVVTRNDDYDPYDANVYESEQAIPGTLRSVLADAAAGSVIGFSSDITEIELSGVGFHRPEGGPNSDAHLIIAKDIVISGPTGGRVILRGASNQPAGDTSEPLTWHSRLVFVAPAVTAELENLTLTGGQFIVSGAGILNSGSLTIRNLLITENRAFADGGGIRNNGTIEIIDSEITDNGAFTEDDEVGVVWIIRGSDNPEAQLDYGDDPLGNGGGVINRDGATMTITNSVISGNRTLHSGGGIYNLGALTVTGTDVLNNIANFTAFANPRWSYGGGIMNAGTMTFENGNVDGNEVADQGGGLWHSAEATSTTLTNVNIGGNTAGMGGQPGFGGGIHHNYFPGEDDLLTMTGVTYTPTNSPEDYLPREIPFTEAGGRNLHPLDYQMVPPAER